VLERVFPWTCVGCEGAPNLPCCDRCLAAIRWIKDSHLPALRLPLASPRATCVTLSGSAPAFSGFGDCCYRRAKTRSARGSPCCAEVRSPACASPTLRRCSRIGSLWIHRLRRRAPVPLHLERLRTAASTALPSPQARGRFAHGRSLSGYGCGALLLRLASTMRIDAERPPSLCIERGTKGRPAPYPARRRCMYVEQRRPMRARVFSLTKEPRQSTCSSWLARLALTCQARTKSLDEETYATLRAPEASAPARFLAENLSLLIPWPDARRRRGRDECGILRRARTPCCWRWTWREPPSRRSTRGLNRRRQIDLDRPCFRARSVDKWSRSISRPAVVPGDGRLAEACGVLLFDTFLIDQRSADTHEIPRSPRPQRTSRSNPWPPDPSLPEGLVDDPSGSSVSRRSVAVRTDT